jgi:hypothetical protein
VLLAAACCSRCCCLLLPAAACCCLLLPTIHTLLPAPIHTQVFPGSAGCDANSNGANMYRHISAAALKNCMAMKKF